jgi:hypothetical protein
LDGKQKYKKREDISKKRRGQNISASQIITGDKKTLNKKSVK